VSDHEPTLEGAVLVAASTVVLLAAIGLVIL
jgi:hypothetical protein